MAIALVQSKTSASSAGVTTLSVVLDSTPTNGNIIVLTIASSQPPILPSTADIIWTCTTDTGGSVTELSIFIGRVITASASATITATTASAAGISMAAAEFSGFTRARIDKTVVATATSTSPNSGNTATTASASQLWMGGISVRLANGVTFSNAFLGGIAADNVYQNTSTIGTTTDRAVCFLYRIVATTGTANANAAISSSAIWIDRIVTIEDTPTGGGLHLVGQGGLAA